MNKYKEALDKLISKTSIMNDTCGHLDKCIDGDKKCNGKNVERKWGQCKDYQITITLKELVERATPKKPILYELYAEDDNDYAFDENGNLNNSYACCPNCKQQGIYDFEYSKQFKHCSNCGQAIDWSVQSACKTSETM